MINDHNSILYARLKRPKVRNKWTLPASPLGRWKVYKYKKKKKCFLFFYSYALYWSFISWREIPHAVQNEIKNKMFHYAVTAQYIWKQCLKYCYHVNKKSFNVFDVIKSNQLVRLENNIIRYTIYGKMTKRDTILYNIIMFIITILKRHTVL